MPKLTFRKPGFRAKPQRAAWYLRLARRIRRKRVAYARLSAHHARSAYLRELARFHLVAVGHNVPVGAMDFAGIPGVPELPGQDWVELTRDFGDLKEPVTSKPAEPQGAVPA
jgi:hypothetical protein